MLDQTTRQAILTLRDAGNGIRAIARALGISRVAVKRVLASGEASPPLLERAEKADAHRDDILALVAECKGNLVRVHEELETRGIVTLSYPALGPARDSSSPSAAALSSPARAASTGSARTSSSRSPPPRRPAAELADIHQPRGRARRHPPVPRPSSPTSTRSARTSSSPIRERALGPARSGLR